MPLSPKTIELVALNAMLIEKNKEFIQAMASRRPHQELVEIYSQVKEIYLEINSLQVNKYLSKVA